MEKKRAQTDRSLRTERHDTDQALRAKQVAEKTADKVVDLARHTADAVVVIARDKADHDSEPSTAIDQAVVGNDRAQADEVLQEERATADDRLRREREECSYALADLLPLERERTDRDLLTERTRSDEELANRDDFLAIVSHDLRNLLGGIVLSSSLLSKRASETDEGKRIVVTGKRIQLYAARMNRLIGDLVDVVSIDAGHLACTIVPSDPLALISETLETFRRAAEDKGILLQSEVTGALPRAAFDYERMLQVLSNLVSNALKFTVRGGKISIRGERTGDEVHLSVSDTGLGIPPNMFDAVFLRFWQIPTNDPRGTGLGLYISKSIVEAHKGRIWIESKVGQGSVFHFTIPVAASA
jgi:signal transduction histidine kinase